MTQSVTIGVTELPWKKCVQGCEIADESKAIYSLGCFHSICSVECLEKFRCLTNKVGKPLSCTICKFPVQQQDLETKIVPTEVFIRKPDLDEVTVQCRVCTLGNQAIAFCKDCQRPLCQFCKQYHPHQASTQSHIIEDNIHQLKQDELEKLKEERSKCQVHTKKFEFYCIECPKKLCESCLESHQHQGNLIRNLFGDSYLLQNTVETARVLKNACESAKLEIAKKGSELTLEGDIAIKLMTEKTELIIQGLRSNLQQFKLNVKETLKSKRTELHGKFQAASAHEKRSQTLAMVAQEVTSNRDDFASVFVMMKYESFINQFLAANKQIYENYDEFVENKKRFRFAEEGNKSPLEFDKIGRLVYDSCGPEIQPTFPISTVTSEMSLNLNRTRNCSPHSTSTQAANLSEVGCFPLTSRGPRLQPIVLQQVPVAKKRSNTVAKTTTHGIPQVSSAPVSSLSPSSGSSVVHPSSGLVCDYKIASGPAFSRAIVSEVVSPSTSSNRSGSSSTQSPKRKAEKRRWKIKPSYDLAILEEAPLESLEDINTNTDYYGNTLPVVGQIYGHLCFICGLEPSDPTITCNGEACKKIFHLQCHAPVVPEDQKDNPRWVCYLCKSTEEISASHPVEESSYDIELIAPRSHYYWACKFLMVCYNIPGMPTMRWIFPHRYIKTIGKGKVPFHLKYIHCRLTMPMKYGKPFQNAQEFISAFRQMFIQGLLYYKKSSSLPELNLASECFEQFLVLVQYYYPEYRKIFDDVWNIVNQLISK